MGSTIRTAGARKKDLTAGTRLRAEGNLEFRRREQLVLARAKDVLGSAETARDWIANPNKALGGKSPLQQLRTKAGTEAVLEVLGRILHDLFS